MLIQMCPVHNVKEIPLLIELMISMRMLLQTHDDPVVPSDMAIIDPVQWSLARRRWLRKLYPATEISPEENLYAASYVVMRVDAHCLIGSLFSGSMVPSCYIR